MDSADGAAVRIAMTVGEAVGGTGREGRLLTVADETAGAEEVAALGYDLTNLPPEIKPHCNARDMMQGGEHCYVIDLFGNTADEARAQHPALYQWLFDRVKPERDQNNRESRRRNWWIFGEPVGRLRNAWTGLDRVILTPETAKHRVFAFIDLPFCPDHKLYPICVDDGYALGVLSSKPHLTWALATGGTLEDRPTWTNTTCFLTFPFPAANPHQQARIRALAEELDAHRKRQQAAHPDLTLTGLYNVLEKLKIGEPLAAKDKAIHEQGLVAVLKSLHDDLDRAVLDAYGWNDLLPMLEIVNGNARHRSPFEGEGRGTAVANTMHSTPSPALPLQGGGSMAEGAAMANSTRSTPTLTLPLQWGGDGSREDAKQALDEALLERLVALNAERAAEEARGQVRWLRPEFQNPVARPVQCRLPGEVDAGQGSEAGEAGGIAGKPVPSPVEGVAPTLAAKVAWPAALPGQVAAVAKVLAEARVPLDAGRIADRFSGRGPWKKRLPQILDTLVVLGRARRVEGGFVAT